MRVTEELKLELSTIKVMDISYVINLIFLLVVKLVVLISLLTQQQQLEL